MSVETDHCLRQILDGLNAIQHLVSVGGFSIFHIFFKFERFDDEELRVCTWRLLTCWRRALIWAMRQIVFFAPGTDVFVLNKLYCGVDIADYGFWFLLYIRWGLNCSCWCMFWYSSGLRYGTCCFEETEKDWGMQKKHVFCTGTGTAFLETKVNWGFTWLVNCFW